MKRVPFRLAAAPGLAILLLLSGAARAGDGPRLQEMPLIEIRAAGATFEVRLAATAAHRAAGFQHVRAGAMTGEAICFRYPEPTRPSFHMHYVARPLWLAWIAPDGSVRNVIRMAPGSTGHRSRAPVSAVLEYPDGHPLAEVVRAGVEVSGCRAGA